MRARLAVPFAAGLVALGTSASAGATMHPMMHPHLAARLAGMGEHGIVNLTSKMKKSRLCWTFDVSTMHPLAATVRDAHGMRVVRLGKHYRSHGCEKVAKRALRLLEANPSRYSVWVATKGHAGELRGKLFAGMAHMG